ncbi:MAG: hypothetical protein L3J67_09750 [Hyphomicrobiaceae bacterium]|nr:hypothetical protein [Hyphomicrobiaceae bacterium]
MRNITTNGACLKVPSRLGLPNQFTLIIPHEEKRYACWVVWGGLKEFGVSFTSPTPITGKPVLRIVKS